MTMYAETGIPISTVIVMAMVRYLFFSLREEDMGICKKGAGCSCGVLLRGALASMASVAKCPLVRALALPETLLKWLSAYNQKKGSRSMRTRNIQVKAMLNQKEKAHFEKQLAATGLTKSELLRRLILKTDIQPKPSEDVIQIYRLVSTVANNANQMAKIANATGYVDPKKVDGLLIMVDKCWQLMKRIC